MKLLTIILIFVALDVFGQKNATEQVQPIVEEGKLLYKSEMASWYGTDLFLGSYKEKEKIGGYFSYTEDDVAKCIFFSKTDIPKVIGTVSFDHTYNLKTARTDSTERDFTKTETGLYEIRKLALAEILSDTLFKRYNNTSLNLVPLINRGEKKVFVLTGPSQNGVVIFGNDYLMTFNEENKLTSKKRLHKNIIPIAYEVKVQEGKEVETTIHSHLPETGDFITSTDICTLMLYEKFAKWKTHNVVSKKYLNIWNCRTDELELISMEVVEKINKDHEERTKKRGKSE